MVLVDTIVLLDVFTDDHRWFDWSSTQLEAAAMQGELAIDPVVYAELAPGFDAGHAYLAYRRDGGIRHAPMPDFHIGAHARRRRC